MAYRLYNRENKYLLGNEHTKEVHTIWNERQQCQITLILKDGYAVGFSPDTLDQAHSEGYGNCTKCLGDIIEIDHPACITAGDYNREDSR